MPHVWHASDILSAKYIYLGKSYNTGRWNKPHTINNNIQI